MNKGGRPRGVKASSHVFELYEDQIITLLADGYRQHEIAETIPKIHEDSVNAYIRNIQKKWGARNTPNLIHLWHEKKNKSI